VRSAIQPIAIEHRRRYGYRRISAELRRRGMQVNHKRVMRIMAEDNLLAVQPKCFVVTTNSDHEFEVYLSLASRMKLTGINQLWVADITYIRLQREFVFLAVILDAFSRKVVGWQLDHTLGFGCRSRRSSERSRNGNLGPVWCIIRIADYSTLPPNT
jgi:transposase InsO family protein